MTSYRARLSGPLLDRIDMVLEVPRQPYAALFDDGCIEETSAGVRTRVEAARERQRDRFAGRSTGRDGCRPLTCLNAGLDGQRLRAACRPVPSAVRLLAVAGERLSLSARAYHRVLRVARTIADLAGEERIGEVAVAEALRYRTEAA